MKNDFFVEKIIWEIFFLSIKHTFTDRAYKLLLIRGLTVLFFFKNIQRLVICIALPETVDGIGLWFFSDFIGGG